MVAVPAATPTTVADNDPTVATSTSLLLQVPPGVGSNKVVVPPTHILVVPAIGDGAGVTDIVFVTKHVGIML